MARGGARPGAGRKLGSKTGCKKATAEQILAEINEGTKWKKLIDSKDENVSLKAMMYLTDRRDGKPKQYTEVKDVTESTPERAERIAELIASATDGQINPGRVGRA